MVGNRIKLLREAKSLSIRHLCRLAGCSQAHLSNVEMGKKQASPALLEMIAKVLGTTATYLRTGKQYDRKEAIEKLKELVEKQGGRDEFEILRDLLLQLRRLMIGQQEELLRLKQNLLTILEKGIKCGHVPEPAKRELDKIQKASEETLSYLRALDEYR